MSEKYDGIRCKWDGRRFISRNGTPLEVPVYIQSSFPKSGSLDNLEVLDGEMWFGRGTYHSSIKISQRTLEIDWKDFKFMVIDAPKYPGVFEGKANCNDYNIL